MRLPVRSLKVVPGKAGQEGPALSSRFMRPALSLEIGLSVSLFSVHYPERVNNAFRLVDAKHHPEVTDT